MTIAKGLHALGTSTFRHPWRTIGFWLVVLAVLGVLAAHFYKPTSSAITIPGTPAQKAIDRVGQLFPKNGGGSGRIVFHALGGTTITQDKRQIEDVVSKVGQVNGVAQAVSPFADASFVSSSGTIAYSQVGLSKQVTETDASTFTAIQTIVNDARSNTLQIEIGGDLVSHQPGEIIGPGEISGVAVALIVLVITFGALAAAGMPIVSALLGIGVSMAGLFALSRVIDISSTTPVLAVMLGLAVGIDYSLFIINKYRSYVLDGASYESAVARALGTAGNAVVFAAFTVIIALSALSVVQIPFMTVMGLVGAGAIAVAAMMALSLTPSLLRLGGRFVFRRSARSRIQEQQASRQAAAPLRANPDSFWYKWGAFIVRHPIPVLLFALVLIGALAVPARELTLGLPTDQYAAPSSSQRKAYDLLSRGFGVGFNGPLVVVVEGLPKVSDADRQAVREQALARLQQEAAALKQAPTPQQKAAAAEQVNNAVAQYAKYVQLQKVATAISKLPDVQAVTPAPVTDDGTAGIIQVVPKTAPASTQTKNLIASLRSSQTVGDVTAHNGATLAVTGTTALQEDINAKLANAMPVYLLVVIGLSLLLLILAFRSILVPIKATLGFLLSVVAMFGAMVAVFQWGWLGITNAPGPIVSFIPIIAIGILFGLAMDYEFFLVSSMHEAHTKSNSAKQAVVTGFGVGSKVVTAAAVIMISVFAGFITNHDSTIQSIGFGLALGILVDAFLVRMTIVPAVMALLGRAAWWLPKWLDRILPHVSIEGEAAEPRKDV